MKKYFSKEKYFFFVGYQHMPVYGQIIKKKSNKHFNNKKIFETRLFYKSSISNFIKNKFIFRRFFTFRSFNIKKQTKKIMYFFHPGGWRKILQIMEIKKQFLIKNKKRKNYTTLNTI